MAKQAIYIVTPVAGFVIMGLEVLGFRVMAASFGSAFYISPVVIGVVLIAMSIGYYLGGWSADRKPELWLLGLYLAIAGIFALLIPLYKTKLSDWVFETEVLSKPLGGAFNADAAVNPWMWADVFFVSMVLFFVPSMMMACVLPFCIRLATRDVETSGRTSGTLIALSSVGSILGVFLTTLVFINSWGINRNLYQFGGALIILSIIAIITGLPRKKSS